MDNLHTAVPIEQASNDLMMKAFAHSATAFSLFLGKNVTFNAFQKVPTEPVFSHLEVDEPLHLLISELRGDLKGTCYLVFTQEDANGIGKTQHNNEYHHSGELQDALLMELDNILTASFITVLANELGVKTHAHVPKLKRGNKMDLFSFMKSDEVHFDLNQKFRAVYNIDDVQIQPVFTWAFDNQINTYLEKWEEKGTQRSL